MSLTQEIAMDVILNVSNSTRTIADIENTIGTGVDRGLTGSLAKNQSKLTKSYAAALTGALRLSNVAQAKSLDLEFQNRSKKIEAEAKIIQKLEASAAKQKEGLAKKSILEGVAKRKEIIKIEQDALRKLISDQASAQASQLELLDAGMKKAAKGYGEQMEDVADSFQSALGKALSAENLDLGDLTKSLGKAFSDNAGSMTSGGAKLVAGGSKAGGAGGAATVMLGKSMMLLAGSAAVIAGVAAAVGALIAVLMAAYGQTKQFNKAILEGSSAVDLLSSEAVGSATALSEALGETRRGAMYLAYDFRTTTEEVLSLGTAMNSAGFTFKEQTKVFKHQVGAMKMALIATQAFGAGAGEVAEMMNMMTRDFAMGQHAIADAFGDIFGAAQLSGMGVKGFFTAVSEATSGMALYNFRLEDTLELMVGLEKILGEDLGKDVMGGLKGKYKDMGFQERYQKVIVAGSAGRKVLGASAERQAGGLDESIRENANAMTLAIEKGLFNKAGKLDLGGFSGVELGDLQNAFEDAGLGEMAIKLSSLAQLQQGAQADSSLGERAGALGELDQAGSLAFDMASAFAVLGDKGLGDMQGMDRMAFEQTTGISGNMFEAYQDISNRLGARLEGQGSGKDGKATMTDIATAIAEGDMLSDKDKAMLEKATEAGMTGMEKIAKSQLTETQSILQTLKTGVVMVLETIYEMFLNSSLFGNWGGEDVSPRKARKEKEKAEEAAANFVGEKVVYEEGATEDEKRAAEEANAEKNAAAKKVLEDKAAFEGKMYEGALGGEGRKTTIKNLAGGGLKAEKLGVGVIARGQGAAYVGKDSDELTEEQIALLVTSDKDREKEADDQLKATKAQTKALTKDKTFDEILRDLSFAPDATKKDLEARLANADRDKKYDAQLEWAIKEAKNDPPVRDFIYRGGSTGGVITPIDSQDSFFGAKPGGAIDKAMGGRGVVINNLTINESGNPQKTLAMVKQAITAARK